MANFSAEEYKKELEETSSIEQLGQKLFVEPRKDQSFVFISYSHMDYKQTFGKVASPSGLMRICPPARTGTMLCAGKWRSPTAPV